ncbi:MAG: hypothetical protein ACAI44_00035 [Candidatus Sericytochromatia bacterium]
MDVSTILGVVLGLCTLLLLIGWITLRGLASKKTAHTGPVQSSAGQSQPHGEDWQRVLHETSAAESELDRTDVMSSDYSEELRRHADEESA